MECKIYDAKIVLEEHDLATGNMICTKRNENCSRKRFIQVLSLQFPTKKMTTNF
jgi:methionyl-tRNA formyltransferase